MVKSLTVDEELAGSIPVVSARINDNMGFDPFDEGKISTHECLSWMSKRLKQRQGGTLMRYDLPW